MAKGESIAVVYPAIPSKSTQINLAYIKAYIADKYKKGEITKKDVISMRALYDALKKEKEGRYFIAYRQEFIKRFFPNLYKAPAGKDSIEDFFDNLLNG